MKVVKKKGAISVKPKREVSPVSELSLPSSKSLPSEDLRSYSILLYGEKKIGKTSLASYFDDAFFLMFEPGGKALSIYQRPVANWAEFKKYNSLLVKDKRFKTVVIDTADLAYKLCLQYVGQKEGFDHPSDEGWGKGWEAVRDEFTSEIKKLFDTGKGVIFTSHAVEKEIRLRSGVKFDRTSPTMAGQARDILEGIVDIWAYYGYDNGQRVLIIEGDDHIGAGHRLETHFRYTDGTPIHVIPMGKSAKEAHKLFLDAFNNQLRKTLNTSTTAKPKLVVKR